jgi:ABC-2 type transport system permease protein
VRRELAQSGVVLFGATGALVGISITPALRAATLSAVGLLVVPALALGIALGSVAFLCSAGAQNRRQAAGLSIGLIVVVLYLMNFMSLMWDPVAWLHWVTPFGYYQPVIAATGLAVTSSAALLLFSAFVLVGAWAWAARRDLAT